MKKIRQAMTKYWWLYCLGFLAMGFGIVLDMYNPIVTGRIIDEVIKDGKTDLFAMFALMLLGITLGRGVFGYAKEMIFDYVGIQLASEIRQNLFDHIQSLSYDFFDAKNTGELMARIKEDAEKIWFGVSFGLMLVVEMGIYIIVSSAMMVSISWKLALLALVSMPFLAWIALALEKQIGKTYENISEQNAKLNTTAQENIAGVRLVKAFGREKHEISKFLERNEAYYKLNVEQANIWSVFYPKLEFFTNVLPILVVVLGGALVIGEELTIGTLVKFSGYVYMLIWPVRMLGWLTNVMAEAMASARKIQEVYKWESKIKSPAKALEKETIEGRIRFDQVGLTLGQKDVLKNISFEVEPGKTLAIMGATGSGKSMIIHLLSRFYDQTKGVIEVDGINHQDYQLQNLRSHIALVMQDVFLFSDTIDENIRFGSRKGMNEETVAQMAMNAQAHDFIHRMESKYDTVIGEKGIGLSGGQKQRISIARAMAKQGQILIFDDSTSALDMATEYEIQKTIDGLEGVTKIIVAHRISAVKNADEILILDQGEIIERGSHESLLKNKGTYYETFKEQYEGFIAG